MRKTTTKKSDIKGFTFKLPNGDELSVTAWTYKTASGGWGHRATINDIYSVSNGVVTPIKANAFISYTNSGRTWECFKYESILYKVIGAYYRKDDATRSFIFDQLEEITKDIQRKVNEEMQSLKDRYNALSDTTKRHLANADINISSVDQMDDILTISEAFDLILNN